MMSSIPTLGKAGSLSGPGPCGRQRPDIRAQSSGFKGSLYCGWKGDGVTLEPLFLVSITLHGMVHAFLGAQ